MVASQVQLHYIGEEDRDLLVLRGLGGLCDWRAAFTTELGCSAQLSAARPTEQPRRGQPTPTIPAAVHASIVSPLVNDVRHIAMPYSIRSFETLVFVYLETAGTGFWAELDSRSTHRLDRGRPRIRIALAA